MDMFRRNMLMAELKNIMTMGGNISRAKTIQKELGEEYN